MRIPLALFSFILISCNDSKKEASYWEMQKDNFLYKDKRVFVIDDTLKSDVKYLTKSGNPLFQYIHADTGYLYSWQERDKTKNEFTVITNDRKYGFSIYYVILNKKDSFISSLQLAGFNNEGFGYWFKSKLLEKDTILTITDTNDLRYTFFTKKGEFEVRLNDKVKQSE